MYIAQFVLEHVGQSSFYESFHWLIRASGKAGNGKWKRKMETEMDAENGNCHGIKLAHAHKNSHEVVTVVQKPGSNPRANACETPFLLHETT